jgi:hypothetical protein
MNWVFISQKTTVFIVTAAKTRKSYIALTGWTLEQRSNVSPVKYGPGSFIPEYAILHSSAVKTSNLT